MTKISFLGAGAIGSMLGGLLQESNPKAKVSLIVRGPHGDVVQKAGGVSLIGPWGERHVSIASSLDVADIAGSEIVFVTVKSQDTPDLIKTVSPFLGKAIVVSIQNGINDHAYLQHVASERLVMGVTSTNIAITEPGRVSLQLDGVTMFGAAGTGVCHSAARRVVDLFQGVTIPGLSFVASDHVLGVRYNKLTINALGYASCLSASNFITEALGCREWQRKVGLPIVAECRRVFAASQTTLATMPGRSDLGRVENLMKLLETAVVGDLVRMFIRRRFERQPIVFSLYQDLKRGKATEVDFINGEIVRLAKSVGTSAPVNQTVVELVHELERRGGGEFFSREEVIRRVGEVGGPSSEPSRI